MEIHLPDGTPVQIRPIRADDKPLLVDGHKHLSPETIRRRFLTAKPRLSSSELRYLTEVDGDSHVALVAVLGDEPQTLIGVARFVKLPEDPEVAEFAIVVGDAYQRRGLGTVLARRLVTEARERGVQGFTATTLSDNVAVSRLIETIGEELTFVSPGGGTREIAARLAA